MSKIYQLLTLAIMLASPYISYGQISLSFKQKKPSTFIMERSVKELANPVTPHAIGCDTLLYSPDVTTKYGAASYTVGAGNGYLSGTNTYNDKQKGNRFDVSSSFNSGYVTGVRFALAKVNGANLAKEVFFRVYNIETNGITLAGSSEAIPLSDLQPLVGGLADYSFPTAIPLTSKDFIISLDFSNLSWSAGDSLAIFSSAINAAVVVPDSAVEQQSNDEWGYMSGAWMNLENGMFVYLFPYVSNNPDCALPIKLTSFSANQFGTANKLEWTTQTETGNKGFEIQRSGDGINYTTIDFVASKANGGNSTATVYYSYVDNSPLSGNNFYRVKQIDINSKSSFSKTLLIVRDKLSRAGILAFYPNPAKNYLNLIFNLPAGRSNVISITDLAGRTLLKQQVEGSSSNQSIKLNISSLPKGNYFIKTNNSDGNNLIKFVKD